jgi:hypothetical protein
MDDISIGPSPKEIMLLGAMVERAITCSCTGDVHDGTFMIRENTNSRLPPHLEKSWHVGQISWDESTIDTADSSAEQNSMRVEELLENNSMPEDKKPSMQKKATSETPRKTKILSSSQKQGLKAPTKVFSKKDMKLLDCKSSTSANGKEIVVEFSADAAARKKKVGIFARDVIHGSEAQSMGCVDGKFVLDQVGFEVHYVSGERIEL